MVLTPHIPSQYKVLGKTSDSVSRVLTEEACQFLAILHRTFEGTRRSLLNQRKIRQARFDAGEKPDFLPETKEIRDNGTWRGAHPAPGLADRRVEITGPTDRKMVVNALNSNVYAYMADFEGTINPFRLPPWSKIYRHRTSIRTWFG